MPYQAEPKLAEFVQSLPKTETHLHIEGACPIELLREVDPVQFKDPPRMWADNFRYSSFDHFMEIYGIPCETVFTSADQYHRAAAIVLSNCSRQNVRYVETSFHSGIFNTIKDTGPELIRAIKSASPDNLEVRVFMGMSHNAMDGIGQEIVSDCHRWEELDGIDLHGPEYWPFEAWTAEVWARAREVGQFTKAHAGEFMGADFVAKILDELKVTRIEHGVRSIEDPAVVKRLVKEGITLDVCPISNVKLSVKGIPNMAAHPIRQLFDSNVKVTINSDDPYMFGNTLSEEYYALFQDLDFSERELVDIAQNGFEVALWEGEAKDRCIEELNSIAAGMD
ncbi:MAG: Adenine deaminase [Candidatus Moanabacter tarae]|uniref:Adenine deaminase n=1 Tax=Candidatus Moanibacter tarae TaxID=2200854 RepID=A0A2Z4AJT8_9BACT|nr:MAG: Adenine deaminase [Candidatus Moanabacter tarae]|tara:strand:+ start:9901 stop:10911 length:1011 start_codon:yes stop_codon:yes gene_type:complete